MTILNRYILRRILGPFSFMVFLFLMALSLERLLRLIEEIALYNAPPGQALSLLLYLVPHYLGLALPAAFFMAVLLGVRGLYEQSELVIMHSSGQPLNAIIKPIIASSVILSVLLVILTGWVQPHSRYDYRAKLVALQENPTSLQMRGGVFQKLGPDISIYADAVDLKSNRMINFFATQTKENTKKSYIIAREAVLNNSHAEAAGLNLDLKSGQIVTQESNEPPRFIKFDYYKWNPFDNVNAYGPRGQDERELTLIELSDENTAKEQKWSYRAEYHARLVQSLSLPFLCILAVSLALWGQGRTGKAGGVVAGVVILVLYEKILGFGEAFASKEGLSVWLVLWGPLLILGLTVAGLQIKKARAVS